MLLSRNFHLDLSLGIFRLGSQTIVNAGEATTPQRKRKRGDVDNSSSVKAPQRGSSFFTDDIPAPSSTFLEKAVERFGLKGTFGISSLGELGSWGWGNRLADTGGTGVGAGQPLTFKKQSKNPSRYT